MPHVTPADLKRAKLQKYRAPIAPRGLITRDVHPKELYTVTGTAALDPANQTTLRTSWDDQFFPITQYVGKRPKPLRTAVHALEWDKLFQTYYNGSVTFASSNPSGDNKTQSGVLNNVSHVSTFSDLSDAAYNSAVSRLYDKLRGSLDLSIDTYQWKQSARLAEKMFTVIRYVRTFNIPKLFDSFVAFNVKRGRDIPGGLEYANTLRKDIRHYAKEGGGLWLEYSYGLKPLISDVFDTAAEFQRSFDPLLSVEGRATMRNNRNFEGKVNMFSYGNLPFIESVKEEYRCRLKCNFVLSTSNVQTLSRFSTLNPLGFIWENTPFSFCVDWFVGVGGYLRSFESALLSGKQFSSGTRTDTMINEATSVFSNISGGINGGYPYSIATEANGYYNHKHLRRTILSSAPFPTGPIIKFDFSNLSKALNAASLLATFLKPKH